MRLALAVAASLIFASPTAWADRASDLLFATGHLASVPDGKGISYQHLRQAGNNPAVGPDMEQAILLEAGPGTAEFTIIMDAEGARTQLDPFRGGRNNPIMLVFLESVVRTVSRATGGSPFYIRRRVQDAFREGTPVTDGSTGEAFTYHPFQNDPNSAALGPFKDLEIRFVLSDTAPGMFVSQVAEARDAAGTTVYREEINLDQDR